MRVKGEIFMYTVEKFEKEYVEDYVNVEEFLEYCKACPNYEKVWSCPSYDFSPIDYWNRYSRIYIVARKIIFDDIRENYNIIVALIISSFLFAIIGHMGEEIINNLLYRFPLGVVFCCIKIKFKKLIYPTIIHATYNICISIM